MWLNLCHIKSQYTATVDWNVKKIHIQRVFCQIVSQADADPSRREDRNDTPTKPQLNTHTHSLSLLSNLVGCGARLSCQHRAESLIQLLVSLQPYPGWMYGCSMLRTAGEPQPSPHELWPLRPKSAHQNFETEVYGWSSHTQRCTFYSMWMMAVIACVTSSVPGHFQQPLMHQLDS